MTFRGHWQLMSALKVFEAHCEDEKIYAQTKDENT